MRRLRLITGGLLIFCTLLWVPLTATTLLAAEATVIGQVNDNFQILSGGQVYEIADTTEGNNLAEDHISDIVKVTGTLEERDGMKIITVISVQVIKKAEILE